MGTIILLALTLFSAQAAGRPASAATGELEITTGAGTDRVWLEANHRGLRVRKFTQRGGASVTEFRHGGDVVVISVAPDALRVVRNGQNYTSDSPRFAEAAQALETSPAMLQARNLLGLLEARDSLTATETSLATVLAFTAAASGDTHAIQRLQARYGAGRRGRVLHVRAAESCWDKYSTEVNSIMDDNDQCNAEALQGSIFLRSLRIDLCSLAWLVQAESAWFEYLNCISILSFVK